MDEIQIFECPEFDGIYTQEFIDNSNELSFTCIDPRSANKVMCEGEFLNCPKVSQHLTTTPEEQRYNL